MRPLRKIRRRRALGLLGLGGGVALGLVGLSNALRSTDVQQQTPDVQQQTPDVLRQLPSVQQQTPDDQQQTPDQFSADWVIYQEQEHGTTFAKKRATGAIETGTAGVMIQYAIDNLNGPKGGKIHIEHGRYLLDAPILIKSPSRLFIEGEGVSITSLRLADGANCNMIEPADTDSIKTFWLHNISLEGNKGNNVTGHGILANALDIGFHYHAGLFNVAIREFPEDGIHVDEKYRSQSHISASHFSTLHNRGHGAYIAAEGCHIMPPNWFGFNEKRGLWLYGGTDHILEVYCEGNFWEGLVAQCGASFLKVWTASNGRQGFLWGSAEKPQWADVGDMVIDIISFRNCQANCNPMYNVIFGGNLNNSTVKIQTSKHHSESRLIGGVYFGRQDLLLDLKHDVFNINADGRSYAVGFAPTNMQNSLISNSILTGQIGVVDPNYPKSNATGLTISGNVGI